MSPLPPPDPGEAQIIDTAETRDEAWAKAREYVELLDERGPQQHWLISIITLRDNAFWIKAEPAQAKHLGEDS
jgi:alkanesulfonate monooxygenase SsuD/methylene tetrahydromethanopterin reductase-like flavin-dependent oxidoreductase (luciferase family)